MVDDLDFPYNGRKIRKIKSNWTVIYAIPISTRAKISDGLLGAQISLHLHGIDKATFQFVKFMNF